MTCHSCCYRSVFYLHALLAVAEFLLTVTLFVFVTIAKPDLFFNINHPDDNDWERIDLKSRLIIIVLFLVGAIRAVILFIFIFGLLVLFAQCCCFLFLGSCRTKLCSLISSKATHRFISFNCNCPCYRARPKLRFQLRLIFVILVSCVRIATIVFCLVIPHHVTTKSLAVIVALSFFFLFLSSLLDYYHYRVWWHYEPNPIPRTIQEASIEIPTTPLSPKHRRFLPYQLLGGNRTGRQGDKLCSNHSCEIRDLEHILIFHLSDHQPQPRWSKVKQRNPQADTYIGFHRTSVQSALYIAHDDFRRSITPPQMLGFGVYFARSIENTIGKARFDGAIIAAEVRMGKVKEVTHDELRQVRNTDSWHPEFDTVYYNHASDHRDEFCLYDASQIIRWIMVIGEECDLKLTEYGMNQEFDDTKCHCI